MPVFVSDSSVLIDLERGGLMESAFSCAISMLVPDLLYENELRDSNGPYLKGLGLGVTALSPDEVSSAQDLQTHRPALSLEDCFALICAARNDHCLLAGDGPLRKEAASRKVICRGLLWLLDEMLASGKVSKTLLCEGLNKISQHPRCRLPRNEVTARLNAWCS
jgi:hypothetical protein